MTYQNDEEEPVAYDGFGAPIYGHAVRVAPVGHPDGWTDLGYAIDVPELQLADDQTLRSWGSMTSVEIRLRLDADEMLETLALMTGYDFRVALCEQKIPSRGTE